MSDFLNKEGRCLLCFGELGPCYHLWTPENFEIIFRNESEFRVGMGIMAIAAKCFPDVRAITFELMTNHMHIMAAGDESRLGQMFEWIKKLLMRKRGSWSHPYHPLSRLAVQCPTLIFRMGYKD